MVYYSFNGLFSKMEDEGKEEGGGRERERGRQGLPFDFECYFLIL